MIRDANVGPADGRVEPLLQGCELADVLGKRRDIFGFIGVGGIAGKEMSVVLHGGAAPRRIDDDRIQRAALRALAINASMFRFAKALALALFPYARVSAPQQPSPSESVT